MRPLNHRPHNTKKNPDVANLDVPFGSYIAAGVQIDPSSFIGKRVIVKSDNDSKSGSTVVGPEVSLADSVHISNRVQIAAGCELWSGVQIENGVKIGPRTILESGVGIGSNALIGSDVVIGEGSVILPGQKVEDNTNIPPRTYPK